MITKKKFFNQKYLFVHALDEKGYGTQNPIPFRIRYCALELNHEPASCGGPRFAVLNEMSCRTKL